MFGETRRTLHVLLLDGRPRGLAHRRLLCGPRCRNRSEDGNNHRLLDRVWGVGTPSRSATVGTRVALALEAQPFQIPGRADERRKGGVGQMHRNSPAILLMNRT